MQAIMASVWGFCGTEAFGVRRSLKLVEEAARQYPGQVYLLGEVVHNPAVVKQLTQNFHVQTVQSVEEIPAGAVLVIRAHGAVPEVYEKARRRGLTIIDATCPIVQTVHRRVKDLISQGKRVLYIASEKTHDEAVGVAGEAPMGVRLTTLAELDEITVTEPAKTVVLTQTTLSVLETEAALVRLKQRYSDITIEKHICMATTDRQQAVRSLIKQGVDGVVVVGSPTSSNSSRLAEVAQAAGVKAWLINNAAELPEAELAHLTKVGVTGGASTPEWLVTEAVEKLESIGK